jgi:hypothetical protein
MSTDLETIKSIAKESLMADFFGARIDEEKLWGALQQLLAGIQLRDATLDKLKQIARGAGSGADFIEKLKAVNLWLPLKDLLSKIRIK